ncbi:MAG: response regulator [Acidimicrobiales bacterium]
MAVDDVALQARLEALFLEELQDNARVLAQGAAALERRPDAGARDDLVQQLFRAAHSLKGAAHSAGVAQAVDPCHRLEELLGEVREGSRAVDDALVTALLRDVDALVVIEQELRSGSVGSGSERPADEPAAGAAGPVPAPAAASEGRARVAVARLDQLVQRAGSLLTTAERVGALAQGVAAARDEISEIERRGRRGGATVLDTHRSALPAMLVELSTRASAVDRELRRAASGLADTAQELRLQPFGDVAAGLDQSVREACRTTGSEAVLVVTGDDVELDRDIGDAIREPLLHLVRNAVGHGIEAPDRREELGKPRRGTVRVSAVAEGTTVAITVADDGAGVDVSALRASAGSLADSDPDDDLELAFLPGLSTASAVTDVSGRGVGLDAVRSRIEALGGRVDIRSEAGRSTEVGIHVPVTLAVLHVVVVDVGGGNPIAVPAASIARLHRLGADAIEHLEGRSSVTVGDRSSPAVSLAAALGFPVDGDARPPGIAIEITGEGSMLLVADVATGLDAELEAVLRPLPTRARGSVGILGAALLPSGRVALVVNPSAALRSTRAMAAVPAPPTPVHQRHTVLLVEDTVTTRALERSILESAGYDVVVAADGAEAWALLAGNAVDVVVSDVDMPRMSGIELCRAIRSSPRFGELPVVLVTSLASADDRRRGADAGANAYLVKSAFDQAALLDAVRRLL